MKEIFLETKDVYTLKELEKVAPKSKGITQQSVKDIVQALCDDSEIKNDKIGISNYFWCFPSDELNNRNVKMDKLNTEIESSKRKRESIQSEIGEAGKGREESESRAAKLQKLAELQKANVDMRKELQQFADNNPLLVQAMKEDAQTAKEAANRWTDNIFSLRSYCSSNFNIDADTFNKSFEIPEDLDYVN